MSQFFAIKWPKYWSFSFNISPSNEYSGLISFRMDWLDLLAVQGTLKSLGLYGRTAVIQPSPTPQFKSINSLALTFLYSPTPTFTHDHLKNQEVIVTAKWSLLWYESHTGKQHALGVAVKLRRSLLSREEPSYCGRETQEVLWPPQHHCESIFVLAALISVARKVELFYKFFLFFFLFHCQNFITKKFMRMKKIK